MALVVKDRVRETSTTTGTGALTLNGAVTGFQSFSVIGDGNTTYYTIVDAGTGAWEVGIGTYTSSGTTLSRDTILESSNSGSAVNFGSNLKDVFVTYPAERSIYTDAAGTAITPATASVLGVASGGTGQSTYTNGQLLIGNTTGNTLTKATLTAGTGISITNGTGSISIAATNNGDVVGPASSTDNAVARFDSTTGKIIQNSGVIIDDSNNVTGVVGQTMSGNLTLNGTAQRILGDFTNATLANRVAFQTSTTNGNTLVNAIPNGTSQISGFLVHNSNDPGNASTGLFLATSTAINLNANLTGTGTYLPLTLSTGGSERMRIDTSGNVGIGTNAPAEELHVAKNGTVEFRLQNTSSSGNAQISLVGGNQTNPWFIYTDASRNFIFQDFGSERMRIDSSGNVGIGTTSPVAGSRLAVVGGFIQLSAGTTSQEGIRIQRASGYASISGINNDNNAFNPIAFFTSGSEAMRIDTSGNVGIGTSSPGRPLDVNGSIRFASGGVIEAGGSGGLNTYIAGVEGGSGSWAFATNAAERMRIDSSGNLLVGKTGAGATTVGGEVNPWGRIGSTLAASTNGAGTTLDVYSTGASAYRFYVGMGGTVFATNTTISAISDQRFKQNIRDLDVGLAEIMQLQPRVFDWKEGKGKGTQNDRGFVAQEFEQVFPDLIDEWKDPAPEGEEPYKSVRADLIPVLVKAIQELKAELDTVKAELATLKGN